MTSPTIDHAQELRSKNFGSQLGLHSVIYPIDYCTSACTYCGLSTLLADSGAHGVRGAMPPETFDLVVGRLRDTGYKVHELVFGTVSTDQERLSHRVAKWCERAKRVDPDSYVIVNCDTLKPAGYRRLRDAGANAIWTFMEVMTPELYRDKHRGGLKSDQAERLEAPGRIRDAGMAVGNALLWGLVPDWEAELERFVAWSAAVGGFDFVATPVLQEVTLPVGVPAPEGFDAVPPLGVSQDLYLEICARLRIAFPDSHLVANTRLEPGFVYGKASTITDMSNGYVWTGSRSHPKAELASAGHVRSASTQMNFFNPGETREQVQSMCPPHITATFDLPRSGGADLTPQRVELHRD
ncbi:MAG TPA: radical SAM protein [Micromonosporaceae bacterium]|nr:radical SAM protein [Micromonosporaceae bacterium]